MRRLLRRRHRQHAGVAFALGCVVGGTMMLTPRPLFADRSPMTIQITSPLGRSGLPGKVRIVARVMAPPTVPPTPVRFLVDGTLLATDLDGPPYAAEWDDENPFETRRIAVEIDDSDGNVIRDDIELKPFEFIELSQIMSVGVDASVRDAKGRTVSGLALADFQLLEDGKPQTLDTVVSEALPATFALLVDTSQSMGHNLDFVRKAAGRFPSSLRANDAVVVAPFKKGITSITGPTRDAATISEAVAAIRPQGGTAIFDALLEATESFADGPGRRVVVLVTDGYDEDSEGAPDQVIGRLKASRITVYTIAIGGVSGVSLQGEQTLRHIAAETGGRAFFPWNLKELSAAHTTIAEDVQHQYQLTYTPTNQEQDGSWRKITVETASADHKVRARTGYRAPVPPPVRASLEFTVTDATHEYAELTRDDLEIIEDGTRQALDVFQEAVAPVSIMLALDASGSMKRTSAAVQTAARTFIGSLRADDPLGLVLFANSVESKGDISTNRSVATEAIQGYVAEGGTALYDAIAESLDRLKPVLGRRVVVVVTDGRDENADSSGPGSTQTWERVVEQAHQMDATVYAIGLGTRVDRGRLEELARLTGGEAYFTSDAAELEQQYRRVVEELHRRYVIAYTSTNPKRDGEWRKVTIRPRQDGVQVRSRGGYFAPQR